MSLSSWPKILQSNWQVIAILLLTSTLRLIGLNLSPPSLYWEEVALSYDAYSIVKTGKDHHGNFLPLVAFKSFGDWKPSGYFYALVPFVRLLGLSTWAVRLPSALAGIVTVYLVYAISRQLKLSQQASLAAMLMLAIMPWHIHFSRAGFEVSLALMCMCLGVWCLLKARSQPKYLFAAVLIMIASMYTYHGFRLLSPLITLFLGLLFWRSYLKKPVLVITSLIIALLLCTPLLLALQSPVIKQRFNETSMFPQSEAVIKTNHWRSEDKNQPLSHLVHHRYWYWGKEIISNSLEHFSLNFLFLTGDGNPRHQTTNAALLYPWMLAPLVLGILSLFKKLKKEHILIFCWIVLASLPPALTTGSPHTLRFLPASPAFAIIVGIGIVYIFKEIKRHKFESVFTLLALLIIAGNLFFYLFDYYLTYPKKSAYYWQDGYQQLFTYLEPFWERGDSITITRQYGRPAMYALYYWQVNPLLAQQNTATNPLDQGELLQLNNVTFAEPNQETTGIIVSADPYHERELLQVIHNQAGEEVFYVFE